MSRRVHSLRIHRRTTFTLEDLAREVNPVVGVAGRVRTATPCE